MQGRTSRVTTKAIQQVSLRTFFNHFLTHTEAVIRMVIKARSSNLRHFATMSNLWVHLTDTDTATARIPTPNDGVRQFVNIAIISSERQRSTQARTGATRQQCGGQAQNGDESATCGEVVEGESTEQMQPMMLNDLGSPKTVVHTSREDTGVHIAEEDEDCVCLTGTSERPSCSSCLDGSFALGS